MDRKSSGSYPEECITSTAVLVLVHRIINSARVSGSNGTPHPPLSHKGRGETFACGGQISSLLVGEDKGEGSSQHGQETRAELMTVCTSTSLARHAFRRRYRSIHSQLIA